MITMREKVRKRTVHKKEFREHNIINYKADLNLANAECIIFWNSFEDIDLDYDWVEQIWYLMKKLQSNNKSYCNHDLIGSNDNKESEWVFGDFKYKSEEIKYVVHFLYPRFVCKIMYKLDVKKSIYIPINENFVLTEIYWFNKPEKIDTFKWIFKTAMIMNKYIEDY